MRRFNTAMPENMRAFVTMKRDDRNGLWVDARQVDRLLDEIIVMAGYPEPYKACVKIIEKRREELRRG